MKTDKNKRKKQAYNQTKYAEIINPTEKLNSLMDWSISELSKLIKK